MREYKVGAQRIRMVIPDNRVYVLDDFTDKMQIIQAKSVHGL